MKAVNDGLHSVPSSASFPSISPRKAKTSKAAAVIPLPSSASSSVSTGKDNGGGKPKHVPGQHHRDQGEKTSDGNSNGSKGDHSGKDKVNSRRYPLQPSV